jgi:hypothetical protein
MKFALCVVSFAQLFVPSSATLFVTLLHSVTYGVVPYTPSVVNSPGQIDREIGRCRSNFSTALLNPTFRTSRVNYSLQPVALLEISVSIYPSEGEKPALRKSFAFKRLQQMCGTWVNDLVIQVQDQDRRRPMADEPGVLVSPHELHGGRQADRADRKGEVRL